MRIALALACRVAAKFGSHSLRPLMSALIAGCGGADRTGPDGPLTFLEFRSDSGDYVGQGKSYRYTLNDANWLARLKPFSTGPYLEVSVFPPLSAPAPWWWDLRLAAKHGRVLEVGTYENVVEWPSVTGAEPGLAFSGSGRACGGLVGRFVISELEIAPDSNVRRLHVTFEQRCARQQAGLRGELSIAADLWR